jgi:hypothetical protein
METSFVHPQVEVAARDPRPHLKTQSLLVQKEGTLAICFSASVK